MEWNGAISNCRSADMAGMDDAILHESNVPGIELSVVFL